METKDLVIRLTGEIQESNFSEFKEEALAVIQAADRPLVTDKDFVDAEKTVKACKAAEAAIKDAKEQALSQTVDISKLFDDLDEISGVLRTTRLSLDKKVKKEKADRKTAIVNEGCSKLQDQINRLAEFVPEISRLFIVQRPLFVEAISGKKKLESMQEAIDDICLSESGKLNDLYADTKNAIETVRDAEKGFPGLFPDKLALYEKSKDELTAIISGRVAEFKLAEAEKEKIAKANAEALKEKVRKANEEFKEDTIAENPFIGDGKAPTETAPEYVKPNKETPGYVLKIHMRCDKETAKNIATNVNELVGNDDAIISISLKNE